MKFQVGMSQNKGALGVLIIWVVVQGSLGIVKIFLSTG